MQTGCHCFLLASWALGSACMHEHHTRTHTCTHANTRTYLNVNVHIVRMHTYAHTHAPCNLVACHLQDDSGILGHNDLGIDLDIDQKKVIPVALKE